MHSHKYVTTIYLYLRCCTSVLTCLDVWDWSNCINFGKAELVNDSPPPPLLIFLSKIWVYPLLHICESTVPRFPLLRQALKTVVFGPPSTQRAPMFHAHTVGCLWICIPLDAHHFVVLASFYRLYQLIFHFCLCVCSVFVIIFSNFACLSIFVFIQK